MSENVVIGGAFDDFVEEVERGIEGKNTFIPTGFPKLDQHIGLGQAVYILIGGESGTGKTALTDTMFVLNPYKWYMKNKDNTDKKLRIIYRSMERSKTRKIAKWVCRKLWLDHNILVDVPTVLGWREGKKKIPRDVFDKLVATRDYFEEMFDVVQITDGATNPTGVYKQCKNISLAEGFLLKSDDKAIKVYSKKYPKGKLIKKYTMEKFKVNKGGTKIFYEEIRVKGESLFIPQYHTEYFAEQDNLINVILGDHNGKWKNERGYSEKQTLDKASDYYGELRDIFKWSPIAVNQFNRNIAETSRRVKLDLTPEKQDFKGSGNMYEDADFVAAIFNPSESGVKGFKGIKVGGFTNKKGFNRFRTLHILKNSYGIDNITTGLNFIGECGHFQEVKEKPSEMMAHHYAKYADVTQQPPNPKQQTLVLT
jgi:hypothetical protein